MEEDEGHARTTSMGLRALCERGPLPARDTVEATLCAHYAALILDACRPSGGHTSSSRKRAAAACAGRYWLEPPRPCDGNKPAAARYGDRGRKICQTCYRARRKEEGDEDDQ
jgi:hypothetical protein